MQMLIAAGVRYIFGNPGTTELPLMDALQDYPQVRYILALQEASAVAMADAYARATGRPAFVNLHITAGLANGLSMLYNAYRGGTPLVLTAGQSDTRMFLTQPVLWGDLVEMTRQFTKWSAEVLHPEEVPMALRRAFRVAETPPTGPVFLSLPWDTLDREAEVEIVPPSPVYARLRPDPQAVESAVRLLVGAREPVLLVGDRVSQARAVPEAVRLAEVLGCKVLATAFTQVNFPSGHPQFLGFVSTNYASAFRKAVGEADVVVAVGTPVFARFLYTEPLLRPGQRLIHIDISAWDIERDYPTAVGVWGDIGESLRALADALEEALPGSARESARLRAQAVAEQREAQRRAYRERARACWNQVPIAPERLFMELREVMPEGTVVAGEAITSTLPMFGAIDFNEPDSYFALQGGALGWGIGGTLGLKLALPDRPVLGVIGDGSAMYTIQGLWTAVKYSLPVVYLICNNRSYRILKNYLHQYYYPLLGVKDRQSQHIGMEFFDHPLDCAGVARGFGMTAFRVERPEDLRPTLERAFALGEPVLVDVFIDPGTD